MVSTQPLTTIHLSNTFPSLVLLSLITGTPVQFRTRPTQDLTTELRLLSVLSSIYDFDYKTDYTGVWMYPSQTRNTHRGLFFKDETSRRWEVDANEAVLILKCLGTLMLCGVSVPTVSLYVNARYLAVSGVVAFLNTIHGKCVTVSRNGNGRVITVQSVASRSDSNGQKEKLVFGCERVERVTVVGWGVDVSRDSVSAAKTVLQRAFPDVRISESVEVDAQMETYGVDVVVHYAHTVRSESRTWRRRFAEQDGDATGLDADGQQSMDATRTESSEFMFPPPESIGIRSAREIVRRHKMGGVDMAYMWMVIVGPPPPIGGSQRVSLNEKQKDLLQEICEANDLGWAIEGLTDLLESEPSGPGQYWDDIVPTKCLRLESTGGKLAYLTGGGDKAVCIGPDHCVDGSGPDVVRDTETGEDYEGEVTIQCSFPTFDYVICAFEFKEKTKADAFFAAVRPHDQRPGNSAGVGINDWLTVQYDGEILEGRIFKVKRKQNFYPGLSGSIVHINDKGKVLYGILVSRHKNDYKIGLALSVRWIFSLGTEFFGRLQYLRSQSRDLKREYEHGLGSVLYEIFSTAEKLENEDYELISENAQVVAIYTDYGQEPPARGQDIINYIFQSFWMAAYPEAPDHTELKDMPEGLKTKVFKYCCRLFPANEAPLEQAVRDILSETYNDHLNDFDRTWISRAIVKWLKLARERKRSAETRMTGMHVGEVLSRCHMEVLDECVISKSNSLKTRDEDRLTEHLKQGLNRVNHYQLSKLLWNEPQSGDCIWGKNVKREGDHYMHTVFINSDYPMKCKDVTNRYKLENPAQMEKSQVIVCHHPVLCELSEFRSEFRSGGAHSCIRPSHHVLANHAFNSWGVGEQNKVIRKLLDGLSWEERVGVHKQVTKEDEEAGQGEPRARQLSVSTGS
ncbi:hypothetical protein BC832DRAFT_593901 [Gaertneriomyces semiglobifer]|nr:hypothetical protein BC832DRAFT_593901 [Gaertneriomyces semiglobifer]